VSYISGGDLLERAREDNVQFIRLQFTDVLGVFKNIAITKDELPRALKGEIFFDGSVIEGLVANRVEDIYIKPDPSTFAVFPWRPREGAVARMICDAVTSRGDPHPACSRQVLGKNLRMAESCGYVPRIGAGIDFYLLRLNDQGKPTLVTHDEAGYCDLSPADLGENARRDMVITLQDMGFDVSASYHEISPGQNQIFLKEDDALHMTDNIVTFKLVVRTIAQRHGLHASFMPKPFSLFNGSGMHLSLSLWNGQQNIFIDPGEPFGLSKNAGSFIAGLIGHADAITAITNPLVNSYKRLASNELAPTIKGWSFQNRNTMIRIPDQRDHGAQVIMRSPDPAANPYLTISACLAAGLEGVLKEITPPQAVEENLEMAPALQKLPGNLSDSLTMFENDGYLRNALGSYICDCYLNCKRKEWNRYQAQVHQWELDEYLGNY